MGPQNGGRYRQVVVIRRWSLAQVWLCSKASLAMSSQTHWPPLSFNAVTSFMDDPCGICLEKPVLQLFSIKIFSSQNPLLNASCCDANTVWPTFFFNEILFNIWSQSYQRHLCLKKPIFCLNFVDGVVQHKIRIKYFIIAIFYFK